MYGDGNYENDLVSRKLEGGSKWVEFDKSPDIDKSLLNDSKTSSFDKDPTEHVSEERERENKR